jgi:serine/tyrosine/threonine adenylyltransferase
VNASTDATAWFSFDNSYARLPDRFYARLNPASVAAPRLIKLNETLARDLNLDPASLSAPEGVEILAGNRIPEGGEPLAMAYAGHQFGNFVPRLGDGRAILIGEVFGRDGMRRDIQLKGAGRTPFSRQGDGRAALGPVLREYIVSEAMAALGVPTTRSLAAVTTGETVLREDPLPGAVLTRIASSHIRVGTFQYFAARGDTDAIRQLADYVIARHYPEAKDASEPYRALLELVIARQAGLIAKWLLIGFIHGVMNTDNMAIAGETIDYGPCAFMDTYHPDTVYSSIDTHGRYAYANQPYIAQWNLCRFAETLLPLLAEDQKRAIEIAQAAIETFGARFEASYEIGLRRKLGIVTEQEGDAALGRELLECMDKNHADFTLTFRGLRGMAANGANAGAVRALFDDPSSFDEWFTRWRKRLAADGGDDSHREAVMRNANPMVVPRNHLVEEAIAAATDQGDFSVFERLVTVLSQPYADMPESSAYAKPPRPEQIVHRTFCGT